MPGVAASAAPADPPPEPVAGLRERALARLALVASFVLLALLSLHTVGAVDSCWQFAAGREIAASGPPSVDRRMARFLAERGYRDLAEPWALWARQAAPGGRGEEIS